MNIACVNSKLINCNTWHRSPFDETAYLYGHFCSRFYPFYRGGKINLHSPIVLVTTKKTIIHNFAGASHKTLLFNYISYFNCPKANPPEYNESHPQTCNLVSSRVVLSRGYRRYCRSFLWKWMKNNPFFAYIVSFLNEKSKWSGFLMWSWILVKKCTVSQLGTDHSLALRV